MKLIELSRNYFLIKAANRFASPREQSHCLCAYQSIRVSAREILAVKRGVMIRGVEDGNCRAARDFGLYFPAPGTILDALSYRYRATVSS